MQSESGPTLNEISLEPRSKVLRFKFSGSAGEYFRIWIVNTLLSIVTLGIYSAWAKVRTKKYLYQHTSLDGSTFDYHANPINILKGRIVVAVVGGLYVMGKSIDPVYSLVAFGLFVLLFPWIVVRGSIFNLSNTSYRGLRFGFNRAYKQAYLTYGKGLLISIITLGIGYYYSLYLHAKFRADNARFGKTPFAFGGQPGRYFRILLFAGLIYLIGAVVGALIGAILNTVIGRSGFFVIIPVMYLAIFVAAAYVRAELANYTLSHTTLGRLRVRCDLDWVHIAWLYVSNLFAIALSLGLAIPWAMVRVLEYRLSRLAVKADDEADIDRFVTSEAQAEGAVSDAAVDFWDIDVGF